ncbi:MAG: hypothetical protein KAI18_03930, partial [Candidatus Aenigmarchaeota archaeon]|nr:hypothetical protein [Candidatus Aenigmarchaeota archaeon]
KKFGSMKTIKNQLHDTICECPSILALEEKTYGLAKELLSEDDFKEECDKSHTIFHVQNKGIIKRNELPKIAKYEQPDFYEHMLDLGTPETTKMLKMGIFERETGKLLRFITNYENNIEEIIGMGINNDIYSSSEFKSFFDLDMETWENLTINKHNLLDLVEKQFGFNISKPYTYRVLTKTVEVPDYMDVEAMTSLIDVQRFFVKIRSYMNARSMLGFSNDESEKKYGKVVDTVVNQLVDAFCPKKNNRKKSKTC